jgi:hypothetical protein
MKRPGYKGYTLAELLVASVLIIILLASSLGAYLFASVVANQTMAQSRLARDVNAVTARLIKGFREGASAYGLRSGSGYTLPQVTEIDYAGIDGNTRKFYLSGNSIVYSSPALIPDTQTIYTAPAGAALTLRFWQPSGYVDNETVGIYFSISQNVNGIPMSASVSTYVNLRNVPK